MAENAEPNEAAKCLGFKPMRKATRFRCPPGACDTHMHIFEPAALTNLVPNRSYTPPAASLADFHELMQMTGIERAVLVQPSVFGTDSTALLETLETVPDIMRGIAVVPVDVSDEELRSLDVAGVRGIRINRRNPGGLSFDAIRDFGPRIAELGWHFELQVHVDEIADLPLLVEQSAVPIVLDHMGFPDGRLGIEGAGFKMLLGLLQGGRTWAKLSSPYRLGKREAPYSDIQPLIEALVSSRPDRLLWASDWPHVELWTEMADDEILLDLIPIWLPGAALQQQVLVDNPDVLYWGH